MVKLTIYNSGKRPELPTGSKRAAHWVIGSMQEPDDAKANMGTYGPGKEYMTEWIGSLWHVKCKPIDEYVRYALGKAKSFNTPRVDIDLPSGLNLAHARVMGRQHFYQAIGRMLGVLVSEEGIELNLIVPEECHPDSFTTQVEVMYQAMQEV